MPAILLKVTHNGNVTVIKIPMAFWAEMEKLILQITGNCQMPQTDKNNEAGPLSDIMYKN